MCLPNQVQGIVRTMSEILSCPLTLKMRTGYEMNTPNHPNHPNYLITLITVIALITELP